MDGRRSCLGASSCGNNLVGLYMEEAMSKKSILSIAPSQEDLWKEAGRQGFVYVKTPSGAIVKDEVSEWGVETHWYSVWLRQRDYGITWSLNEKDMKKEK